MKDSLCRGFFFSLVECLQKVARSLFTEMNGSPGYFLLAVEVNTRRFVFPRSNISPYLPITEGVYLCKQ